ncbi:unnamed protein product [Closterium sp. NIES-53]
MSTQRRSKPYYAKIATPLTNLLKKNTPFKWEDVHQQAMEQLKTALTSAPVLILPDPEKDYVIEADASDQAVGAVLVQDQGKGLQPIAYLSKKLHGAELNYPIHDKEALAIITGFKTWRCYLEGRKTTVYTDHCSLKYLKTQPTLSRRQVRWIDFLETQFDYDIVYKPGHKNKADALSRPGHWDHDVALRKGSTKIWVPNYPPLWQLLLEKFHDVLYAGHFGSNKTLGGIAKVYYWPHMENDVQKFVTSCDTCQRMKSSKQKKEGLLQPLPVPEQPWQVVSLDFITGLPPTNAGHDAILVVIDKFSKMGNFIPTHTTARTEETAQLFLKHIISQHGIPTTLISDRDPKFTSKFWKELMSLMGTRLAMSSAYHPQSDGQTERLNQICNIRSCDRRLVYGLRQTPREWHDTLRTTLAALRFAPSIADLSLFLRTDTSLPPFYILVYVDDLVFATANTEALALVKSELQKRHRCTDLGFTQRQGVDFFQTFSLTPKMTTLRMLLHVATQRDYELHSLDFSTTFLQGSLHEEIWLRRPPGFTGTTLAALGFAPLTADPSLFLRTDTSLPPFYVLVSFSASASGTPRHSPLLCLPVTRSQLHLRTSPTSGMGLVLGGRGPFFQCGEAEIYVEAMVAQELRWLTYMLTDLGERPRSSPVQYVENKAMIALCLEHRTKHIALRYFLARELQQRGHLCLAYVATRANAVDIFTKALQSCDHRRFCNPHAALPCPSRCPAGRALPCLARRGALHVASHPALPVAPPCWPCAALPCPSRRPAGSAPPSPACRVALLAAASPCPARAPPCWPPRRPALPAHRPALPTHRTNCTRTALPCPRAALLAAALPCHLRCPALAARRSSLAVRRPALPCALSLVLVLRYVARQLTALYLLSNSRDSVSLFDHTSGASLAPPATAESATRSQWLTRDGAARLTVRNHLPLAECAHFGQHKTTKALYDAVVARFSSPATDALGRLILPYLFPELSTFATIEDLITHLRTSNIRYRAALAAEFVDKNPPPMDHFLTLDPTDLTLNLLEKHLLAAETSTVAVGAARGTPRTPFFEGCSPSPLAPSYASAATIDILGTEDIGAASVLSGKCHSGKGKGGKSGGDGNGGGGSGGGGGGGGGSGSGGGSGGFGGGCGGSGNGGGPGGAVQRGGDRAGQTCGKFHTQHRCFYRLEDAWRVEFGDEAERPRCLELLRSGVVIFALDYDAILAAIYALTIRAEGDCYLCVPPNPSIEAAALGASESVLLGIAPAEAVHTIMLDSGASRFLARSSTVLPCPAVPSGSLSGLHLPSFSTNLVSTDALQDAMVTTTTPGGQSVSICTCTRTGRHLATFTRRPGSSLYTLTTEPPPVSASPPALACPALPYLRRGAAAHRFSLLLVSLDDCSPADSPHGRVGPSLRQWTGPQALHPAGSRAFVRHTFADKLSSRAIPCVFLGFLPDAPGWHFYHPTSCRVLSSQDATFDESVPFYPPSGVSQVDPPPLAQPVDVTVDSGAARGAASGGAEPAGAEPGGVEPASAERGGAEPEGAEPGGAESQGAESGGGDEPEGAEPGGAESEGAESGRC